MTRYLARNEILNTKNNEFNDAAMFPVGHELPRLRRGQINVAGIRRRQETWNYLCVWKDRIIVASTCRHSVQFGCYITWIWMANCVSVMIKGLPLFNFTISCYGRRVWRTSRCACALTGSRCWLVEPTLSGDHVSLSLHWEFSLKFNFFLINYQELTRSVKIFLVWNGAVWSAVIGVYHWILPKF